MRVKFLRSIGKHDMLPKSEKHPNSFELPGKSDGNPYQEGETADIREADAQKFLALKLVEPAKEEKK